jgi:hypothetical protein
MGGSIIFIALLFLIFNIPILLNSIYSVAETTSINSELDDKISKTDTKLQEILAFSGSNVVNFDLLNDGNEKLWNYDKFNVIITYDADMGGASPTTLTEQLTYDGISAFDGSVVNGTADFRIQRGTSLIPAGSATTTITEGVGNDFMMCQGDCFIKYVSSRNSGMGRTSLGGNQNHDEFTAYISDITGLTTQDGTITFARDDNTGGRNNRVTWEIWEYIGDAGDDNEMTVLDAGVCPFDPGALDFTCNGAAIAGGATDDSDVVVFVTGAANPDTTNNNGQRCMVTSDWDSANNWPVFTRSEANNACDVSYAVVEWTGSNWNVQRITHDFTAGPVQTEAITTVGDISRAFFHTQQRIAAGGGQDDASDAGSEVELVNPTTIEYRLPQNTAGWGGDMDAVTWVISNSDDTEKGEQLIVNHYDPAERTGIGVEEDNWQVTLNPTLTYPVNGTAITGMSDQTAEGASNFPQGFLNARLTDSSTVDFWRGEESDDDEYTFQTTEFTRTFSCLSDNPGLNLNPGEWTVNYIIDDNLDPQILNSNECVSISAKLSNPISHNGLLIITISTDNAIVSTQSQTVP